MLKSEQEEAGAMGHIKIGTDSPGTAGKHLDSREPTSMERLGGKLVQENSGHQMSETEVEDPVLITTEVLSCQTVLGER